MALNAQGLARYLPVNTIPMLIPSLVWNSLFIKSFLRGSYPHQGRKSEGSEVKNARDNLSELFTSLTVLRSIYVGGSFFTQFVSAFLRRAKLILACHQDASHQIGPEGWRRIFELEIVSDKSPLCTIDGPDMVPEILTSTSNDPQLAVLDVSPPYQVPLGSSPTLPGMDSSTNGQLLDQTISTDKVPEEGDTWHSMFNFTAFDGSQLVESWDTNTLLSPVANGNIDPPAWESLGQNWDNCLPTHEVEDT